MKLRWQALVAGVLALFFHDAIRAADGNWVAAWSAAPVQAPIQPNVQLRTPPQNPDLRAQSLREFFTVGIDGSQVRVHLDNRYGALSVRIAAARIARATDDETIDAASSAALTVHGKAVFELPPGAVLDSDPVALKVHAGERLALSLYLPDAVQPHSWHGDSRYKQQLSQPGDHTQDARLANAIETGGYDWLSRVDVQATADAQAIVMLGDSITNGFRATPGHSYPEQLLARLQADGCARSVLNAGIDGNQVAAGLGNFGQGDPMRTRLAHDVLDVPGARYVMVLGGVNDIGEPSMAAHNAGKPQPDADAMAQPVIAGLKEIIARARAKGLRVYGATILPFAGTQGAYSEQGERAREQINRWIRRDAGYDAVIDFDAVMSDPQQHKQMLGALNSGDHIHPNDAGYRVMAEAIPLALFGCTRQAAAGRAPLLPSGPDPWVTQRDGWYYFTYTEGDHISLRKVRDVLQLGLSTPVTVWRAPASGDHSASLWAPELHWLRGKWYLYYSASDKAHDDDAHRHVFVLENANADPTQGQWLDKGMLQSQLSGIDGTVFEHADKLYFVYSAYVGDHSDLIIAPMPNPWALGGPQVDIAHPTYAWEKQGGRQIMEAPEFLAGKKGQLLLTYSASACWSDGYSLGLLQADGKADPLDPASWHKSAQPVLASSPSHGFYAPGHNGFYTDAQGQDWIIFHANGGPDWRCTGRRAPYVLPFHWDAQGLPVFMPKD